MVHCLQNKASVSSVSALTSSVNRISTLLDEVVRRTDEEAFENLVPGGNGNWQIHGKGCLYDNHQKDIIVMSEGNLPSVGDIIYITNGTNPYPSYTDSGNTATVLDTLTSPNRLCVSQDITSVTTTNPTYNNIFIWLPTT